MTCVVIDTNVLLGLWMFRETALEPLRIAIDDGSVRPVRSAATDAEFTEVLSRKELFEIEAARRSAIIQEWQARATLVEAVGPAPWQCRDPLDQKFLDLAVTVGASQLLTRDRDLLKLAKKARRNGLAIVAPEC